MKRSLFLIILAALLLLGCAGGAKTVDAPKPQDDPAADCGAAPVLTLTEQYWTGWQKEQPEPTVYTFENIKEGTVIYESLFGTVRVAKVTDDSVQLTLENACFVEPNQDGRGINLMADPLESITVRRGEEKVLASQSMDAGVWLTVRVGEAGVSSKDDGYRLIVNGTEVPVDSYYTESAKGEALLMLPITALFRGIGCETERKGDTVEIKKDGALWLVLDLNAHTLTDPNNPEYDCFMIAPGGTNADFKRQRSGDELWVCRSYAGNAFAHLGMPMQITYDKASNEMRVAIKNTDG